MSEPTATGQLPLFPPQAATGERPPGRPRLPLRSGNGGAALPSLTSQTPLKAAIGAWQQHMRRRDLSEHTVKAFSSDLNLLSRHRGPATPVGQISTRDLNSFLQWMQTGRGRPCSPKTYSRRVTSVKSFFRWLAETGVLQMDPARSVLQHSVLSPLPTILSEAQIGAAQTAARAFRDAEKPDARPAALFELLLQTGIKKGECLTIHTNHVDLSDPAHPFLFVRYQNPRNRYKERKLTLTAGWLPLYHEYLGQYAPDERLFPWSPRRLEYLLADISQAAGLEVQISFDMLRWTCAARDLQGGMEPDAIRQKLGVSRIQWREVKIKLDRLVEGRAAGAGQAKMAG